MAHLEGQVALITGGAGGLGTRTAVALADAGATVVIADISADALARATASIGEQVPGARLRSVVIDVTSSEAVRAGVEGIVAEHGRLDILVTSHGFPRDGRAASRTQ